MPDALVTGSLQSFASLIDDAALRFEQAWEAGPAAPAIESFLPPEAGARDPAALRLSQIDIERRTAAGEEPRAESYLERFPALAADPDDVFALVLTEAESRLRRGSRIDPDDYRRRFPGLVDRLIAWLLHRGMPRVPGYEILGELGRGGMGAVYKARHLKLDRTVALKVVTAPDRQSVARFLLEARAVAAVRHPHVIEVFDSGECDGLPYLAMEYLDGGSLHDLLKREPLLPPDEAARLVAQLADGVQSAHEAGTVHRDLKPANVLFDSARKPKVADFGLAMRGGVELTQTQGRFLGTPAYAAPEQVAGRREFVGPAADVWSLGVILYECLTGQRPFTGDDALSVLNKVQTQPVAPPRSLNAALPRDLELICLKCLEKNPADRYPSAAVLAADLGSYLAGRPVSVRPAGPRERLVKLVRRNPVPAALAAVFLLGCLATTSAALVALRNARQRADAESARVEAEREAAASATRQLAAEREQAAEKERRGRAERQAAIAAAAHANDLQRVVDMVEAAEREGLAVPPESRFAAAAALGALGRADEAQRRLTALLAAPDIPAALRPRAELWLVEYHYGVDDATAGRLLRSARASELLSPADLAYAEALEQETMAGGVARLQEAVRHDPTHFPARRLLGVCLLVSGRLDEAIRAGEESRLLVRDHPEVLWPLLFAYGFKGDAARARETFERLRPHVPPDLVKQIEMLAKFLPYINAEFRAAISGNAPQLGDISLELALAGGPQAVLSPVKASNTIKEKLVGRMPPMFRDALDDYLEFTFAQAEAGGDYVATIYRNEARVARLKANMERRPEGFMRFVYALTLTYRALGYSDQYGKARPHTNRFREMCLMAADAYAQAADTPALIDIQSVALEGAALHYGLAARPAWVAEEDTDRAAYDKAVVMVRRRLALPEPLLPERLESLSRICRNAGEFTTARRLVDEWQRREPRNPAVHARRAEVEFKAGAHLPAIIAARESLYRERPNAAMQKIEAECLAQLKHDPDRQAPMPRAIQK